MRRVNYGAETLVTGNDAATALINYASLVVRMRTSVAVQISALETNGTIRTHTLLLGPATQLDIFDIDGGESNETENSRFPVPRFPEIGGTAAAVPNEDMWIEAHTHDGGE